MTFERTNDMELVRRVLTHPKVYPWIADDLSPAAKDFNPLEHSAIWYVKVTEGDELLGLFVLAPQNGVCWEGHTCLLPNAWGERARAAARGMAEWAFSNTPCKRIITNVPRYNRLALRLAKRAGLSEFGVNSASFLKNGILHDQIMLGVSKGEI